MRLDKVDSGLQIFYCLAGVASPGQAFRIEYRRVISENVGSASHPDFNWRKKTPIGPLSSLVAFLREGKIGKRVLKRKATSI